MSIKDELDAAIATALTVPALTGTATGGVWNGDAVQGSAVPYVTFNQQSEVVEQTFDRQLYNELYVVKAVVRGYPKVGNQIDAICHSLLNNKPLTIAGVSHIKTLRVSAVNYPEPIGGVMFRHIGGIYRIFADKAG